MPSAIVPKALKPGATIAFISPSARLNDVIPAAMERATALLVAKGYKIREIYLGPDSGIQSSIANRLSEIRTAFTDPSISAIICTIGGPSFTELLPSLLADTELHKAIRADPKIVVGYSDITGLHWFLHAIAGLRTFYGPGAIPELGASKAADADHEASPLAFVEKHLFRAIADTQPIGDVARSVTYAPDMAAMFKEPSSVATPRLSATPGWRWLRQGKGQGRLFGGCLTVMARLGGVRAISPDWRGRIVFLETASGDDENYGNPLHRVQAGVADLIAHGVFEDAAGLVVGRPYGYDTPELIAEYTGAITGLLCEGPFAKNPFPILFGVDFGHTTPMVTLPYDALAVLDSEKDKFAIIESAVGA